MKKTNTKKSLPKAQLGSIVKIVKGVKNILKPALKAEKFVSKEKAVKNLTNSKLTKKINKTYMDPIPKFSEPKKYVTKPQVQKEFAKSKIKKNK